MKLRERIIDLSTRIATVRSRMENDRIALDQMLGELDAILAPAERSTITESQPASVPTATADSQDANTQKVSDGSIANRIGRLLAEHHGVDYTAPQIYAALGDEEIHLPSIRAALSNLTRDNIIEKMERGVYRGKPTI